MFFVKTISGVFVYTFVGGMYNFGPVLPLISDLCSVKTKKKLLVYVS